MCAVFRKAKANLRLSSCRITSRTPCSPPHQPMGAGHWAVPQIPLNEGLPAVRPSQYCLRAQSCLARGVALPEVWLSPGRPPSRIWSKHQLKGPAIWTSRQVERSTVAAGLPGEVSGSCRQVCVPAQLLLLTPKSVRSLAWSPIPAHILCARPRLRICFPETQPGICREPQQGKKPTDTQCTGRKTATVLQAGGTGGRPVEQRASVGRGQPRSPGFGQVEEKALYPSDSHLHSPAGVNCRQWVLRIERAETRWEPWWGKAALRGQLSTGDSFR